MKKLIAFTFVIFCFYSTYAQENLPGDYLSKDFHKGRREAFRNLMPANSVAFIFSFPERTFSNDENYKFHQNPDLYYLTGYNEPNGVLVLFKDLQGKGDTAYNEIFFVRERNEDREMWTGRRLGIEGAKTQLGFSTVFNVTSFKDFPIDYKNFDFIIHDVLPTDVKNNQYLFTLLKSFKEKAVTEKGNTELHELYKGISKYLNFNQLPDFIAYFKTSKEFSDDPFMTELLNNPDSVQFEAILAKIKALPKWGTDIYAEIIPTLREIKTPEELTVMRKSINITCIGHSEVMKAVTPDMSEREVEGIHSYIHKKYGAEDEGFPPIIGAGANGCILHYMENSSTKIENQLVVMDVGCEYHGYSADVTRTIPANGKFTAEQKAIYQLVFYAQEEIFKLCKEGTLYTNLDQKAREIIANGLIQLGIISDIKDSQLYFPHGCSHSLGLDVHDKSAADTLKENMVITVEPGIYIPANSKCDKNWWNIGVRIEDDVLVMKNNFEILSSAAPRKWDDIEKKASEKSMFNKMDLPRL